MQATVQIQGHIAHPQPSLRVLGIHLDPKLNWGAHVESIQLRVEPQIQALGRLAQSTWGATFHKAKLVYNAVVRPAITYGAPIWAEPGMAGKIPKRVIKPLRSIQRRCLKIVTGAYNSTSSKVLEHETSALSMETYLKLRRVQHAGLSKNLRFHDTILLACRKIKQPRAGRQDARAVTRTLDIAECGRTCGNIDTKERRKAAGKVAAFKEWERSWTRLTAMQTTNHHATADPKIWNAVNLYTDEKTGKTGMSQRGTPSSIHKHLSRAQSSIAM